MATIGLTNMNDSGPRGPLTADELRPFIPRGCDQQGRFPEAAEAATEVGTEEDRGDPLAVFVGMRNALLMTAGVALIVCGIAVLIVGWP